MKKIYHFFRTQLTTLNFHKENNFDKHHKFNSKYVFFHTYACLIELYQSYKIYYYRNQTPTLRVSSTGGVVPSDV
jgi:hypothetical protein